jgi:ATP-dependent Clp protease ATP-binding subunit ClpB
VQSLLKGEKEKLINMEDSLRMRVVGQDHVLASVSDAVRISRANLQTPTRPVASFLFLGPTGVGKVCTTSQCFVILIVTCLNLQTELCKALASFLFSDEQRGLFVSYFSLAFHFGLTLTPQSRDQYERVP